MSQVDDRIERLIVRRLDGELSDEEALELDRELLRSPQARQLLEEYRRIDGAAVEALTAAIGDDAGEAVPFPVVTTTRRKGYSRLWWALPAAVAATLALIVMFTPRPAADWQIAETPPQPVVTQPQNTEPTHTQPAFPGRSGIQQAGYGPGSLDRAVNQDLLYILGDDGNIYVIDRQHMRTARKPDRNTTVRRASGDL
ncbi:MAG TPA: hypothetical protein VM243_01485 [Phycisphaerae bacterium]|nr:hypothetical protein [Phycisphaerae bacterium]